MKFQTVFLDADIQTGFCTVDGRVNKLVIKFTPAQMCRVGAMLNVIQELKNRYFINDQVPRNIHSDIYTFASLEDWRINRS